MTLSRVPCAIQKGLVSFPFKYSYVPCTMRGFPGGSDGKESACNAGNPSLIPGSGRSPGGENGNPLQYSCLENPMDREAWQATVAGVATKSWPSIKQVLVDYSF